MCIRLQRVSDILIFGDGLDKKTINVVFVTAVWLSPDENQQENRQGVTEV